jgi:hypothetical protein
MGLAECGSQLPRVRSSAFNTSEARPYFINEGCYGDDLVRWLIGRLRAVGIRTDDEPGQEDFGWYFQFTVPAGKHCCLLGFQPDAPEGRWLLWLERSRGFVGSLLGPRKRGIDATAVQAIQDALSGVPGIRELQWQEAHRR